MGILSRIFQRKAFTSNFSLSGNVMDVLSGPYEQTKVETLRQGLLINPHLYSAVSFQASKAAMIGFSVNKVKSRAKLRQYAAGDPRNATGVNHVLRKQQALEELENHRLVSLLEKPNRHQGYAEFMEFVVAMLDLTGNAYIWKVRSNRGGNNTQRARVMQLIPLNPVYTSPYRDPSTKEITHFQTYHFGQPVTIDARDVVHVKQGQVSFAEDIGRGSYESAGLSIKKSNNVNITESSMIERGGVFGLLSPKQSGSSSNPYNSTLKPETKDKIETDIRERAANPNNAGAAIIPPVEMDWQRIGLNPSDMNFERARLMSLRDICNCANLPAQLFNDSEASTYDNMAQARRAAYTDAILPKIFRIRDALNKDLVDEISRETGEKLFLDFDTQSVNELQQDMKEMSEWLKNAYWLRGNEKRAAMGYNPDPDTPEMDEGYFIPSGLTHTNQLGTDPGVDPDEAARRALEQNQ